MTNSHLLRREIPCFETPDYYHYNGITIIIIVVIIIYYRIVIVVLSSPSLSLFQLLFLLLLLLLLLLPIAVATALTVAIELVSLIFVDRVHFILAVRTFSLQQRGPNTCRKTDDVWYVELIHVSWQRSS